MILRLNKGVFTAPLLSKQKGIRHGFGTRQAPPELGWPEVQLKQIHSDVVRVVDGPGSEKLRGDALVTATPGLALTVVTADCLPVLLFDPKRKVVAAAHAGWRGTLMRITEKTVGVMRQRFRVDPANVIAAFGPSIQVCCYEVGEEVMAEFHSQFPYADDLFQLVSGENPADVYLPRQLLVERTAFMRNLGTSKGRLDLVEANYRQLVDAGLKPRNIHRQAPCTADNLDLLCSYRRQGPKCGRLVSAIGLLGKP